MYLAIILFYGTVIYFTFPETKGMTAEDAATAFDFPRSQRRGNVGIEASLPVSTLDNTDSYSIRDDTLLAEKASDDKREQE